LRIVPLANAHGHMADMATCILVGSVETRIVERPGLPSLVYTPRHAGDV
jgi:precorrin-3B C17-methyltransferase